METEMSLKKQRDELQEKLLEAERKLAEKQKAISLLTSAQCVAEELHAKLCHMNHTDQCDWGYKSWNDQDRSGCSSRSKYHNMAKKMLMLADKEIILKIISVI